MPRRDTIPRRAARVIIANAARVVHRYKSLDPLHNRPWEEAEISVAEMLALFEAHPRWKLERRSDGTLSIHVPNEYAYENYVIEPR